MITEETFQKLNAMRMVGFAHAFQQQLDEGKFKKLAFDERVGLMVDREWTEREDRRLTRRLQQAKLRDKNATVEDIDYRHPRGLDRSVMRKLSTCEWVRKQQNIIITGPTGCGKTYLTCALAQKACREGYSALYRRVPRLLSELAVARADGSLARLLNRMARADVLVLDDWGLSPMNSQERRDLLEVLEDRHGSTSTMVASQLPVTNWHKYIGEATVADAILDRLVHNAHQLALRGASMRKKRSSLTQEDSSDK